MAYEHGYADLPPDPLCKDTDQRKIPTPRRKRAPDHYFHVPIRYTKFITGLGLTAAATILLFEAHRRVKVGFGPLPLTAHTGKTFGMNPREVRTAREQLQRHQCAQWAVYQERPLGAYLLTVNPDKWTDGSEQGDATVTLN